MSDQFAGWKKLLAGEHVDMHENEPLPGYYRVRMGKEGPWAAVAIWKDEEGALQVVRSGQLVDADKVWPYCARNPIAYATYVAVTENGEPWPDAHPSVTALSNNPPADDSFESLSEAITDLSRDAEKLIASGGAKTQAEADRASDLANKLGELWKKADERRKVEKAPYDEAARTVQQKWTPIISAAEVYKRIKAAVITPFLAAEDRKRRDAEEAQRKLNEEAVKTGAPVVAPPTAAPTVKAGSGGRRSVHLRTVKQVEITDRAALLAYFADNQQITDLLQTLSERAVRAGVNVPGVKITETQVAA